MAVTMDEVSAYSADLRSLVDGARTMLAGLIGRIPQGSRDETAGYVRMAVEDVMERYGLAASELGLRWYERCADGQGTDSPLMHEVSLGGVDAHVRNMLKRYLNGEEDLDTLQEYLLDLVEDEVRQASRDQITTNLDRDQRASRRAGRGDGRAGYARVPVGDTCAWCLMLAGRGYVYRSFESAGGLDPDHYHAHCDCVPVAYNDPMGILGYGDTFRQYEDMYSTARSAWEADELTDDERRRLDDARERHDRLYAEGKVSQPWTDAHAISLVMREKYGIDH